MAKKLYEKYEEILSVVFWSACAVILGVAAVVLPVLAMDLVLRQGCRLDLSFAICAPFNLVVAIIREIYWKAILLLAVFALSAVLVFVAYKLSQKGGKNG